jgi:hypothetical protein
MRRPRSAHRLAAVAALVALSLPGRVRADGPPQPAIDAQALYDRAMAVLGERRYDAACPMFEEVARLVPESSAAKTAVAECHVRAGRAAMALKLYTSLEEQVAAKGELSRVAQVRARLDALRATVPELIVEVPEQVLALPGLEIRLGGVVLGPSELDVPMRLDPGSYLLEVTATDRAPFRATVAVTSGVTSSVKVGMPRPLEPPRPPPRPPEAPRSAGSAIPGIVVLSAGVTALVIGTVTGIVALGQAGTLKGMCQGNVCPPSQQGTGQAIGALGTVSTAELVIGAAVAGAGVTLLVLRPFGRGAPARVTAGPGFVGLVGRF